MITAIYRKLSRAWGPQNWWPAQTPFEVIVGAILTQNTSWTNVERALSSLRTTNALDIASMRRLPNAQLEQLVRPSGYFRQKARRLKSFIAFLDARYSGSPPAMFATPALLLREQLLELNGIGPETADSILLYAGHHPLFVVDAYTRRVLERHDVIKPDAKYDEIRSLVEQSLRSQAAQRISDSSALDPARPSIHAPSIMAGAPREPLAQVYNEMHGLFVQLGKHYCSVRDPKCETCPLGPMLIHRPKSDSNAGTRRRPSRKIAQA